MPEFFKADRDGHILTITLNRPERMNALHSPAHLEKSPKVDLVE